MNLTSSNIGGKRFYRASVCTEFGKPLMIQNMERQEELSSGEVRVQVSATGINFGDLLMIVGKYQVKVPPPFTPGSEFAGTILEVADDVEGFKPGMRVAGSVTVGAFSEEVVGNAQMMWEIPEMMTFEEAASFVISYGTAYMGLKRRANVHEGETVLVTASAGATGLAAVDLASNVFNCKVIGACGSDEKCEFVKSKGAHHAINYRNEEIKSSVMNYSEHGADVVFEAVGGKVFKDSLRSIAWEGRLLVVGFASGEIPQIPANHLLVKNASAVGLYWGAYSMRDREAFNWSIEECMKLYKEGKIKPHYSASFPLKKVNDAFKFIQQRKSTGKVVITMR